MLSPEPYATIDIPGNHIIRIYDHSKVYFGDYYRVRLQVKCEIPLSQYPEIIPDTPVGPNDIAVYNRFLERMAVPSAAVEDTRLALIAEFRRTSLPYLAAADFPLKLIARSLSQQSGVTMRYTMSAG